MLRRYKFFSKGKTIFDVLEMTVDEAAEFFEAQPKIHLILETLQQVGMGYVKLGQPSTTFQEERRKGSNLLRNSEKIDWKNPLPA